VAQHSRLDCTFSFLFCSFILCSCSHSPVASFLYCSISFSFRFRFAFSGCCSSIAFVAWSNGHGSLPRHCEGGGVRLRLGRLLRQRRVGAVVVGGGRRRAWPTAADGGPRRGWPVAVPNQDLRRRWRPQHRHRRVLGARRQQLRRLGRRRLRHRRPAALLQARQLLELCPPAQHLCNKFNVVLSVPLRLLSLSIEPPM
jgi:hypothetical protein